MEKALSLLVILALIPCVGLLWLGVGYLNKQSAKLSVVPAPAPDPTPVIELKPSAGVLARRFVQRQLATDEANTRGWRDTRRSPKTDLPIEHAREEVKIPLHMRRPRLIEGRLPADTEPSSPPDGCELGYDSGAIRVIPIPDGETISDD